MRVQLLLTTRTGTVSPLVTGPVNARMTYSSSSLPTRVQRGRKRLNAGVRRLGQLTAGFRGSGRTPYVGSLCCNCSELQWRESSCSSGRELGQCPRWPPPLVTASAMATLAELRISDRSNPCERRRRFASVFCSNQTPVTGNLCLKQVPAVRAGRRLRWSCARCPTPCCVRAVLYAVS